MFLTSWPSHSTDFSSSTVTCQLQMFPDVCTVVGCIREGDKEEHKSVVENTLQKQNHLQQWLLVSSMGSAWRQWTITKTSVFTLTINWTPLKTQKPSSKRAQVVCIFWGASGPWHRIEVLLLIKSSQRMLRVFRYLSGFWTFPLTGVKKITMNAILPWCLSIEAYFEKGYMQ